ncbi:MAG: MarR family transcriptional regulator [Coriobacteriales bacterium]|nr:MarR family transcriptional regulator [Coriobacteriales bacterium]
MDPIDLPPYDRTATLEHRVLHDLGYFGHYLFVHAGGRGGKQRVLARLYRHDGRLPQRSLIEHSGNSPAALSEVLSKLEAEGLIQRTRSHVDRRQLDVVLTQKGSQIAHDIEQDQQEFERQSLAPLSDAQKSDLVQMLDQLVAHWDTIEKTGAVAETTRGQAQAPATQNAKDQKGA